MMLKNKMNKRGDQSPWVLISLILALVVGVFFVYNLKEYGSLLPANYRPFTEIESVCSGYTDSQTTTGDEQQNINNFVSLSLPDFMVQTSEAKLTFKKGFTCYYLSKLDSTSPYYITPFPAANQQYDNRIKFADANLNQTKRQELCDTNTLYVYSVQYNPQQTSYSLGVTICNPNLVASQSKKAEGEFCDSTKAECASGLTCKLKSSDEGYTCQKV